MGRNPSWPLTSSILAGNAWALLASKTTNNTHTCIIISPVLMPRTNFLIYTTADAITIISDTKKDCRTVAYQLYVWVCVKRMGWTFPRLFAISSCATRVKWQLHGLVMLSFQWLVVTKIPLTGEATDNDDNACDTKAFFQHFILISRKSWI